MRPAIEHSEDLKDWPDERLVDACLRDDEVAWNALVERYKGWVFSVCLEYTRSEPDAADVFQDVWAQAHRRLGTLRDSSSLRAWLGTVARNACYLWLKKQRRRNQRESQGHGISELEARASETQIDLVEKDSRERVHAAIGELPPRCQEVIRMLFFRHPPLPYRDLAGRLEVAIGSVPFLRARCLERLHRLLDETPTRRARRRASPLRPPL